MQFTKSPLTGNLIGMVFGLLVVVVAGCVTTQPYEPGENLEELTKYDDLIVARVGETNITLADVFQRPDVYVLIDESLIVGEVIMQEGAKRGIVIEQDEIEAKVAELIEANNGWEEFVNAQPKSIPPALLADFIRKNYVLEAMRKRILEHMWDTEEYPPSEEEIRANWNEHMGMYRARVGNELGIDHGEVTFEMARDTVVEGMKEQFVAARVSSPEFWHELADTYDIDFYLRNRAEDLYDVIVPELTEEDLEGEGAEGDGTGEESEEIVEDTVDRRDLTEDVSSF